MVSILLLLSTFHSPFPGFTGTVQRTQKTDYRHLVPQFFQLSGKIKECVSPFAFLLLLFLTLFYFIWFIVFMVRWKCKIYWMTIFLLVYWYYIYSSDQDWVIGLYKKKKKILKNFKNLIFLDRLQFASMAKF